MNMQRANIVLLVLMIAVVILQLAMTLSTPATALDAKVGSDSATIAVSTSADGMHVYVCDGQRCYASHDGAKTFIRLKID